MAMRFIVGEPQEGQYSPSMQGQERCGGMGWASGWSWCLTPIQEQ